MNLFIGIGKIVDSNFNGKILKFDLAISQAKPCLVPCLIFDPNNEVKKFVEHLESTGKVVWLQGKIASYEFEHRGNKVRKIDVVTYGNSIKTI